MRPRPRLWTALALACPILALGGLALHSQLRLNHGMEVRLPVSGFDPRDLLSGHYLTWRVEYGLADLCQNVPPRRAGADHPPMFVCVKPRRFAVDQRPDRADCTLYLAGVCEWNRFAAGVERFYIPEQEARALEQAVMQKKGEVLLVVGADGQAVVKELFLEGKTWRQYLAEHPTR